MKSVSEVKSPWLRRPYSLALFASWLALMPFAWVIDAVLNGVIVSSRDLVGCTREIWGDVRRTW